MSPTISVVVCVYNGERYLRECLDSLSRQTCKDFEVVLVDDGSTDSSGDICDEYAGNNEHCSVCHGANQGLLLARRMGMKASHGDYVMSVDADDCLREDAVARVAQTLGSHRVDICCFDYCRGKEETYEGAVLKAMSGVAGSYSDDRYDEVKLSVCQGQFVSIWNKAFKRDVLGLEGSYGEYAGLMHGEDWLQSISIVDKSASVFYVSEPLYFYREYEQASTGLYKPSHRTDLSKVFERLLSTAALWGPRFEKAAYQGICKHTYWLLAELSRVNAEDVSYSIPDEGKAILAQMQSRCGDGLNSAIGALRCDCSLPLRIARRGHIGTSIGIIRLEEKLGKALRMLSGKN